MVSIFLVSVVHCVQTAGELCRGMLSVLNLYSVRQGKLTTHREEAHPKNPNLQDLLSAEVMDGLCPGPLTCRKHSGSLMQTSGSLVTVNAVGYFWKKHLCL